MPRGRPSMPSALDTAVQAALNAFGDALTALADYLRVRDAVLRQAYMEVPIARRRGGNFRAQQVGAAA